MTAVARPATGKLFAGPPTRLTVAGNMFGAACILANWWQAAETADLTANLSSAGPAIAGIAAAGLGNALWLLTARGAVARRRRNLSSRVTAWAAPLDMAPLDRGAQPAPVAVVPDPPRSDPAGLIAVEGATLYHRPGCPLVGRKRTSVAAAATHQANGLRPCGVCEPAPAVDHDGVRR